MKFPPIGVVAVSPFSLSFSSCNYSPLFFALWWSPDPTDLFTVLEPQDQEIGEF